MMNVEEIVIPGRSYEFDCEYITEDARSTYMIAGLVLEFVRVGDDSFIILDECRAINVRNITRVIGPYPEVK